MLGIALGIVVGLLPVIGGLVGVAILLPVIYGMDPFTALPFLLDFMDIPTAIRPASYIKFVTSLLFWIGIAFEFPLIIFGLAGMGIVRAENLLRQWRIAIVVIAIVSAMITPTIDPVNMALVMGPMIILYFLSVGLAFIAQGKREKAALETQ